MRRRRRAPTTQLARAGERTILLVGDEPVPEIWFRASTLSGTPRGRIEIDTGETLPRTAELGEDNRLDATGLKSLAVIPEADTAISFRRIEKPGSTWVFVAGSLFVAAAVGWTAWEFLAG
ncbi:MAG: hypothetical protein AAF560_05790 [Acidobacteriota bacterium]